jgi:hypothetical protein
MFAWSRWISIGSSRARAEPRFTCRYPDAENSHAKKQQSSRRKPLRLFVFETITRFAANNA